MKVAIVASEIYPFAKTGGLADMTGALTKEIANKGIRTFAFMPLYKTVNKEKFGIKSIDKYIKVYLNNREYIFEIYKYTDHATYFFFKNDELFGRDFLYSTGEGDYPDNDIRFGAFNLAVLEFVKSENINIDIFHIHDWQTSLLPVYLKEKYPDMKSKTILTIHNLAYQGIFDKFAIERLNLGWHLFNMEALEFWDKVNFLKGGIVFSDIITTVSPTYAKEILTPEYGYGLDGVLRKYSYKLFGIINGIDYDVWNPETDEYIYYKYCWRTFEKYKPLNKKEFLKDYKLEGENKPLFIFIGRFAKQKGVDLIIENIENLSSRDMNLAILGSGDKGYTDFFSSIIGKYPNIYIEVGYDEPFSRKMYASADFLLMPSLFEPCGLNQMIAMRYGTLVVAHKTGGLADTIIDISEPNGYGILFENLSDFITAVDRAILLYNDKERMKKLIKEVMQLDFSLEKTASSYIRLYQNLIYG